MNESGTSIFDSDEPRQLDRLELARGERLDRRFTVRRRLGQGRLASVFLADDAVRGEAVALKIFDRLDGDSDAEQGRAAAGRELKCYQQVSGCSHIRPVHELHVLAVRNEPMSVLVMAYADQGTLANWLEEDEEPSERWWRRGLRLFTHACRGVAALHAAGWAHRDLRPDNIMLINGMACVADLDAAVRISDGHHSAGDEGIAADMVALAKLLTRIADTTAQAQVPDKLRHIVDRLTGFDGEKTYGSAVELMSDLDAARPRPEAARLKRWWQAARTALTRGNLEQAHHRASRILAAWPEHRGAARMLEQLQQRRREADHLYQHLIDELEAMDLTDLLDRSEAAARLYPGHPQAVIVQTALITRADRVHDCVQQAVAAVRQNRLSEAYRWMRNGLRLAPRSPLLREAIDRLTAYRRAHQRIQQRLGQAIAHGQWPTAAALAQSAERLRLGTVPSCNGHAPGTPGSSGLSAVHPSARPSPNSPANNGNHHGDPNHA